MHERLRLKTINTVREHALKRKSHPTQIASLSGAKEWELRFIRVCPSGRLDRGNLQLASGPSGRPQSTPPFLFTHRSPAPRVGTPFSGEQGGGHRVVPTRIYTCHLPSPDGDRTAWQEFSAHTPSAVQACGFPFMLFEVFKDQTCGDLATPKERSCAPLTRPPPKAQPPSSTVMRVVSISL